MREQQAPSLFEAALEEFQVARQISTGQGQVFLPMCGLSRDASYERGVPGEFLREELGYDGPVGYRLREMVPQDQLDARHQERQVAAARPVSAPDIVSISSRRKQKRENKWSRKLRQENVETQALLRLRRVAT